MLTESCTEGQSVTLKDVHDFFGLGFRDGCDFSFFATDFLLVISAPLLAARKPPRPVAIDPAAISASPATTRAQFATLLASLLWLLLPSDHCNHESHERVHAAAGVSFKKSLSALNTLSVALTLGAKYDRAVSDNRGMRIDPTRNVRLSRLIQARIRILLISRIPGSANIPPEFRAVLC